jgi:hypothetical protein
VLYSIRSERLLMEELDYNLLFRWFVGLSMDDAVWDPTVFTKNRERLLSGEIDRLFFQRVQEEARQRQLLSDEHFTVDGTLVEAWAGHKSFKPKEGKTKTPPDDPGNPTVDFIGEKRSNKTHASTTDPDARLYRKSFGTESKLCFAGHILMDNRHGLAVDVELTQATSLSEREAALSMAGRIRGFHRVTLGGDKAFDVREFVHTLRAMRVTPHIAGKNASYSAIDGRTTRFAGYVVSRKKRKRSKRSSVGSRPWRCCGRRGIGASRVSAGLSPSPPRSTTWFEGSGGTSVNFIPSPQPGFLFVWKERKVKMIGANRTHRTSEFIVERKRPLSNRCFSAAC